MITLKINITTKLLFADTDSLMYVIKPENVYKEKNYDNWNKLVIGQMRDETGSVAIEEFVRLTPKIYSFLVDNKDHKKAKGVNRNIVATISNEYKDVLLNNTCIRDSMNRIQSKDHRIEIYEIYKISLFRFDDKIYIQNNEFDRIN